MSDEKKTPPIGVVGAVIDGVFSPAPDWQRAAERVIRGEHLAPLYEPLAALTEAVLERTGRHGITRVSLAPDVGLSFGIAPGTSVDVHTPAGRVEVYAERGPRHEGTFTIPEDREDEPPSVGDDNYLTKLMHPGDEDRSER